MWMWIEETYERVKAEKDHFDQTTKAPVVVTTVRVVDDGNGKKIVKVAPVVNSFAWVQAQWYDKWASDKDPVHAAAVAGRVERDILPFLGQRPIAEIEAPEIAAVALAPCVTDRGEAALFFHRCYSLSLS